MSGTHAVPSELIAQASGQPGTGPLCPACTGGRLHPYKVEIPLGRVGSGFRGATRLEGWVAVCQGSAPHNRAMRKLYERNGWNLAELDGVDDVPPCGLSVSMTPK